MSAQATSRPDPLSRKILPKPRSNAARTSPNDKDRPDVRPIVLPIAKEIEMPRRIIATDYVSLDGVIQDPVGMEGSGLGDWTGPFTRGPEGDKFKLDELRQADALLFGRLTYDGFAAVWPTVKDEAGFAKRMNSLPKYVASRTLKNATWNNSTIIGWDLVGEVKSLRAQEGGDVLI